MLVALDDICFVYDLWNLCTYLDFNIHTFALIYYLCIHIYIYIYIRAVRYTRSINAYLDLLRFTQSNDRATLFGIIMHMYMLHIHACCIHVVVYSFILFLLFSKHECPSKYVCMFMCLRRF